jgi:Secretion system C-terminal sorting domain
LLSFHAKAQDHHILLDWETASELNNRGFELQRRAEHESEFKVIGWIKGKGSTSLNQQYIYKDKNVLPNTLYYYRLRQIDFDNRATFSETVNARIDLQNEQLLLFPNPTTGLVMLHFGAPLQSETEISLRTVAGQQIQTMQLAAGLSMQEMDLSRLPANVYLIYIQNEEYSLVKKVLVE